MVFILAICFIFISRVITISLHKIFCCICVHICSSNVQCYIVWWRFWIKSESEFSTLFAAADHMTSLRVRVKSWDYRATSVKDVSMDYTRGSIRIIPTYYNSWDCKALSRMDSLSVMHCGTPWLSHRQARCGSEETEERLGGPTLSIINEPVWWNWQWSRVAPYASSPAPFVAELLANNMWLSPFNFMS